MFCPPSVGCLGVASRAYSQGMLLVLLTVSGISAKAVAWPTNPTTHPIASTSSESSQNTASVNSKSPKNFDDRAAAFLAELEPELERQSNIQTKKEWNFEANITDHNEKIMQEGRLAFNRHTKEIWAKVVQWDWKQIGDDKIRRQFKIHSELGPAALPDERLKRYNELQNNMAKTYATGKICSHDNPRKCDLKLSDLTHIFSTSRNAEELKHVWLKWRDATGKTMRHDYKEFVTIINEIAKANNLSDGTEWWLSNYETADFQSEIAKLWKQLTPLYQQLHAYVRNRLRGIYGEKIMNRAGPIPAHLLGNMWAQQWGTLISDLKPYPGKPDVNVGKQMMAQNYTPLKMFKVANEFFTSLGLEPMTPDFWYKSILERPSDGRELVCHPSAWDFYDGEDVRIKQCTKVNTKHLVTVHHEMGHIQYFLQYRHQPIVFRSGANSGFHEAVGDTLALSVQTPKHLKKIGLLDADIDDPEVDLNFLMSSALSSVAFLPFGYLIDKWRWGIFSGNVSHNDLNCEWWKLREELQGIKPPQVRSEEDFDPGAKFHIPGNTPYIRYFVARILQFQFHKALCLAAEEYSPADPSRPLHQCDIYRSTKAGSMLGDMLKLGRSVPWPDALEVITGQRQMDAAAIREYFAPLEAWLKTENERTGETIGWKSESPVCVKKQVVT